jgi:hypothetical protein
MPAGQPGDADGLWDAAQESPRSGTGPPGPDASPASQPSRFIRSRRVVIAIVLAIAVTEVGVGLLFAHPGTRHPLASGTQLHPPAPSPTSPPPSPTQARSPKHPGLAPRGLISFEDGTDGWKPLFGRVRSAQTTQVAYRGAHSLLITARSTYSAVGVENGLADLHPGDQVTFHIYSDGQHGGSVLPFAERWNKPEVLADNVQLPSHPGWLTVTWVVPSVPEVNAIGLQVVHHGSGPLTLAIDALTWPGS